MLPHRSCLFPRTSSPADSAAGYCREEKDSPRWFLPSAKPFEGFVDLAPEHFHFFKRIPLSHGTLPPRDIIAMNLATEHWLSSRKPAQLKSEIRWYCLLRGR